MPFRKYQMVIGRVLWTIEVVAQVLANQHGHQISPRQRWSQVLEIDGDSAETVHDFRESERVAHALAPLADNPLAGGNGWTVTNAGGSLSQVNWVELHADTWDAGFDIWVDAVSFY